MALYISSKMYKHIPKLITTNKSIFTHWKAQNRKSDINNIINIITHNFFLQENNLWKTTHLLILRISISQDELRLSKYGNYRTNPPYWDKPLKCAFKGGNNHCKIWLRKREQFWLRWNLLFLVKVKCNR